MTGIRNLLIFVLILSAIAAFAQEKPVISVLPFATSDISKGEITVFIDFLTSHIVETGKFRVIDRMQRETILQEIEFSQADCTDERCQLEIGKILAANQIVVGSLGKVQDRYFLNIKLVEVQTGETISSASEIYKSMNDLLDMSRELVARFLTAYDKKMAGEAARSASASKQKQSERAYRGLVLEPALGAGIYPDDLYLLGSLSLVYQFNAVRAVGLQCGLHVGLDGGTIEPSTMLKLILGNKTDGWAFALLGGIYFASDPFKIYPNFEIGVYYRNFFLDIGEQYLFQGISLSFGYSFALNPKLKTLREIVTGESSSASE